jgi:hypothetical protein
MRWKSGSKRASPAILAETIPDRAFVNEIYRHDLAKLIGVAGLANELKQRTQKDATFAANWAVVTEWTPEVRYGSVEAVAARLLMQAITDEISGVFPWIRTYW